MKKYAIWMLAAFLSLSCNSQEKSENNFEKEKKTETESQIPKGSWEVHKEFDEAGNLTRYDSIYSWSSGDDLKDLGVMDRDSVLKSLKSRFYSSFSGFSSNNDEFESFFQEDSLFTNRFFKDDFFTNDFGRDFMDLDHMQRRMEEMQRQFMERYQLKIDSPIEEDDKNKI